MLKLYYILNKILNTKFPACKYKILPLVGNYPRLRTAAIMGRGTQKVENH